MRSKLASAAVGGMVALLVIAGAAWAASPAATPKPMTFHLVEVDHSFHLNDIAPKLKSRNDYFSAGDSFVFTSELKSTGGKHTGWLDATCTVVSGGKTGLTQCQGSFRLAGGELIAAATAGNESGATNIAIVGGTGAYAGFRGTVRSVPVGGPNSNRSNDTFTLWK
jgi:hypothetical protein